MAIKDIKRWILSVLEENKIAALIQSPDNIISFSISHAKENTNFTIAVFGDSRH